MERSQKLDKPPMSPSQPDMGNAPGGHPMEIWISYVLRVGVLLSGAIVALGLLLLFIQGPGPGEPASLNDLHARGSGTINVSPLTILHGVLHGRASSVIEVGLLLLILTPIARVAMTVILFLSQRDRIFVAVTCIVLAILVVGLIGVGA